ncbi:MAG TPA: hypothetical protein VI357_09055 [Mycobacteriales bacterium]
MGRQCPGELFDGTPCNSYQYVCQACDTQGCHGDGCEWQAFETPECDGCGRPVARVLAMAS